MKKEYINAYVTKADDNVVRVKLVSQSFQKELVDLGFFYSAEFGEYIFPLSSNQEKAKVFNKLRILEVSFSDGKEWCPAEVFEYLREIGLLTGSFKRISWRGPDDYHLTVG